MIGSLRGTVIDREVALDGAPAELTIEVAGVGYRVQTTAATSARVPADTETLLFVHHHIREADQRLYGFLTVADRNAFEGLLGAHGVGPSLALAVMATHPVHELARILNDDDLDALCQVPGVGKKTAQRLLVELKNSVVLPVLDGDVSAAATVSVNGSTDALGDVREALTSLGYSTAEVRKALATLKPTDSETMDSGQLLKKALLALSTV